MSLNPETGLTRSRTLNEGIQQSSAITSSPSSSDIMQRISLPSSSSGNRPKHSRSSIWGWLGFRSSDSISTPPSSHTSTADPHGNSHASESKLGYLRKGGSIATDDLHGKEDNLGTADKKSEDEHQQRPKTKSETILPKGAIRCEVNDGDTLQSIAVKLNVTVGEITKLNKFTTRILFPGQVINVPDPDYIPEPPPPQPPAQIAPDVKGPSDGNLESTEEMINEDYECVEKFVKARTLYLPDKTLDDAVPGTLLITPNAVMFDPNAVAAQAEQLSRDEHGRLSDSEVENMKEAEKISHLPPGDLLLPMTWIAAVTIFRQIPDQTPVRRPRAVSATVGTIQGSIVEESELAVIESEKQDEVSHLDSAFDSSTEASVKHEEAAKIGAKERSSSISAVAAGAGAVSGAANLAVAAVSESATAISGMSSQLAGALGTPLKRISLGTLAKMEPAISQSVETFSHAGGEVHLSDPAAPTSLFLRITGSSFLSDESMASLGFGVKQEVGKNPYPEYWFRIPAKSARGLQLFFTHWNPEMAGMNTTEDDSNPVKSTKPIGFRPPDNIARTPDAAAESQLKEWEVISIDESIKRNQAEDAEIRRSLPLPDMQGKSAILSDDAIRELCTILPPICIGSTWALLYNSTNDGFSLSSLFRAALTADSPQLLIVHELSGATFGAVSSCRLRVSDHFYGSSECCLFTFFPNFRVFRWSGENTFFIRGNRESLCFGSANGINGLWLDSDLYRGRTRRCATYDNDLLTAAEDFTIDAVELWGFPS